MSVDPRFVVATSLARRRAPDGLMRRLGLAVGIAAVTFGAAATQPATAQDSKALPANEVPASWRAFARMLQLHFQDRLSSDSENVRRVRDTIAKRANPAASLIVEAWVLPDGMVSRVELEGAPGGDTSRDLNAVLLGEKLVPVPPPDMPQPVRLRLSLRKAEN